MSYVGINQNRPDLAAFVVSSQLMLLIAFAVVALLFEGCLEKECKVDKMIIKIKNGVIVGADLSGCGKEVTGDAVKGLKSAFGADAATCDGLGKKFTCEWIDKAGGMSDPKKPDKGGEGGNEEEVGGGGFLTSPAGIATGVAGTAAAATVLALGARKIYKHSLTNLDFL